MFFIMVLFYHITLQAISGVCRTFRAYRVLSNLCQVYRE
jgi:hypothetical protein